MQSQTVKSDSASTEFWERRAFEKQLTNVLPELRAFARFLAKDPTEADDLVQDTVVRALRAYKRFDLDTNIKAWTFTILRNLRINSTRKMRCEPLDETIENTRAVRPSQHDNLELKEVLRMLDGLSAAHREVIILIRGSGVSYEEAAEIMGCKIGTIKSRLNRADAALREAMGAQFWNEKKSDQEFVQEELGA